MAPVLTGQNRGGIPPRHKTGAMSLATASVRYLRACMKEGRAEETSGHKG
jgi:hypothetical protein